MEITQCSYCGMSCFNEEDICSTCREALGQTSETIETPPMFESNSDFSGAETFQPVNEIPPPVETPPAVETVSLSKPPPRRAEWKRCPICTAGMAQHRDVCMNCETVKTVKKSGFPLGKVVFLILFLTVAASGYFYFRNDNSPSGIIRRFEKATGTSRHLVFDTFVIKGDAKVTAAAYREMFGSVKEKVVLAEQKYYFDMFYKNHNKTLLDFYEIDVSGGASSHKSVLKQGFNGTNGWKYTNLFNQPAKLEDTGDSFGERRMGMGLEEYESIEIPGEAKRAEYGEEWIKSFDSIKTIEVDGAAVPSEKKTYLIAKKQKGDGQIDESLLVFDEKAGFLVGMLKKSNLNGTSVLTQIFADSYKKYYVKERGWFGVSGKFVLIPSLWKFNMPIPKPPGTNSSISEISVNIELKVESVSPDIPVDDAIFEKPAGK